MEINFKVINASELQDGDVFYCTPNPEINDFGPNFIITGTDQIFIRDDHYDNLEDGTHAVVVNGGYIIWFRPEENVIVLTHYSELLRVFDMVKEGNPQLNVGENDFNTLLSERLENGEKIISPLDILMNSDIYDDDDEFEDDIDHILDMQLMRSSTLILRGTDAFYKWANTLDGSHMKPDFHEATALLLDDIEIEEDLHIYIEKNHKKILEYFFNSIWTDESDWPQIRDISAFNHYIKWEFTSMVFGERLPF
jgi:hypothetical protein